MGFFSWIRNFLLAGEFAENPPILSDSVDKLTRILNSCSEDNPLAAEELLPLVYDELRKLASARLQKLPPGQTLQPTALVHEAWIRIVGDQESVWDNRGHFFAAAAEAMRRILIDGIRKKQRLRRGGDRERISLDQVKLAIEDPDDTVLAVHEALEKLAQRDENEAELVKLRYFIGLSHEETAEIIGVSEPTVRRRWSYVRAWLYAELKKTL